MPPSQTSIDDSRATLRIGYVARELAVTVATVRRWSDNGTLRVARLPSGQRRYSPADVDRVRREMWDRGAK